MEASGFLGEYRSISNKLKKRFLRKPNVSEAGENYRSLAKKLEENGEPQYAGFCHLAAGRCEQTVNNSYGEIDSTVQAARSFLKAEKQLHKLKLPSFEEYLSSAMAAYSQAAKLQEEAGRPACAAGLFTELANHLRTLDKPAEALHYYEKAVSLEENSIMDRILLNLKKADCLIVLEDYHNAVKVLTEVANIATAHDPLGLYHDHLANVEVLDRYKDTEDDDNDNYFPLTEEMSILLKSVVLAVKDRDPNSLMAMEDEIHPRLTQQQRHLLRVLVNREVKRGAKEPW